MPRRVVSGKLAAQSLANGLIASARNLSIPSDSGSSFRKVKKQEWHTEAWFWYDTIEVFHYGVQWIGNTLSRAKLIVTQNGEATTNPVALDALNRFFGGPDQHGEFLRQAAIHMTVCGEGYIFARADDEDNDDWAVIPAVEVKSMDSEGVEYKVEGEVVTTDEVLLIRFWRPHPRKRWISDSPTRALLADLAQADELQKYVSAQLDSRLTSAGILVIPSEVQFPTQTTGPEGEAQQAGVNGFIKELVETAAEAKKNRQSAAARVPIVVQAPAEYADKLQHLTFWSGLDENAEALRAEAIRRIALGMDMPPEALLGTGDMNHWGAWQIEDSLIKSHSEPLLALLTQAITTDYLRVLLEESGMAPEEAATFDIAADTSEMRLRPNRSKEALELWDRGELSGEAMRRENGFDETDKMADEERGQWLLKKLAQGSPSPELVQAAVDALGIKVNVPEDAEPSGERPLPRSLEGHPTQDPPERNTDAATLLAAGEAALFTALTRAGNRLKSTSAKIEGIPANIAACDRYLYVTLNKSQMDAVLHDAWPTLSRLTLPERIDRESFETALDNYARLLISNKQPYERSTLALFLTHALEL